ncbi:MAG: non-canonical purine NTP pyrophosphatase [Campylobacter sp.]
MKIVLATSNSDKVKEIREILKDYEIYALNDIMTPFEIVEDGDSFQANALIKAKAVYKKLVEMNLNNEFIALSDDSGISVDALGGKPGIYSARFSGKNANDASNKALLINELKKLKIQSSNAHYTACIAVASKFGNFTKLGFMHGTVIDYQRGKNGFGYDALFVPDGFNQTLGELNDETKAKLSHRFKALELIKPILENLKPNFQVNL